MEGDERRWRENVGRWREMEGLRRGYGGMETDGGMENMMIDLIL